MSEEYRRGRKHGWIQVGLFAFATVAVVAWSSDPGVPRLSDEERSVLIRENFTPVEVVKEVRVPVEIEVPVEVPVREVVEIEVPGAEREVIRHVPLPQDCPPVGPVNFSGGCQAVVVGRGDDLMTKGRWWADVAGNGWEASDERELEPDEIRVQIDREALEIPKWRFRWWAGGVKVGPGVGPIASISLERRRWALQAGGGVVFSLDGSTEVDDDFWLPTTRTEPLWMVMLSRKGDK